MPVACTAFAALDLLDAMVFVTRIAFGMRPRAAFFGHICPGSETDVSLTLARSTLPVACTACAALDLLDATAWQTRVACVMRPRAVIGEGVGHIGGSDGSNKSCDQDFKH